MIVRSDISGRGGLKTDTSRHDQYDLADLLKDILSILTVSKVLAHQPTVTPQRLTSK